MQISESLYAKLASAAAKDLVEKQVPLNESVDKLAASHDMNTAQLERLCEATNNQAFTALFEQRAKQGSDDRLVEFAVAKPREILDKRVGAEKTAQLRVRPETFDAAWESRPLPSVADRYPTYGASHAVKTATTVTVNPTADRATLLARLQERGPAGAFGHPFLAADEDAVDYTPMAPEAAQAWLAQNAVPDNYPSEPSEEDFHRWRSTLGMPAAAYPHAPGMKQASHGDPFADVPTKPASPLAIKLAMDHLRHEKIAEAQKLADATNAVADHFRPMYARQGFAVFQKEAMALHKEAAHEVLAYVRGVLKEPAVSAPDPDRYLVRNDKTAAHQALRTAVGARQRLNAISAALRQNGQG